MIGWIIEVAYVYLVGDGDDITLSTNFTDTGSNKVHRCYSDIPAGIWEIYVCCHDNKSICMDNPAASTTNVVIDAIATLPSSLITTPTAITMLSSSTMVTSSSTPTGKIYGTIFDIFDIKCGTIIHGLYMSVVVSVYQCVSVILLLLV